MRIKVTSTSKQLSKCEQALIKFGSVKIEKDGERDFTYVDINSLEELITFKDTVKQKFEVYGELIITNDETTNEPLIEIYDYFPDDD